MLRSMTGFGSVHGAVGEVEYAVELKSVNNRYFKASIKLPEMWASAETEIEKLLRERLSRGSVNLSVRMRLGADQAACRLNIAALSSYIEQLKLLEIEGNPTLRIDLASLLQLPGVAEPPPMDELVEASREGLMDMIRQALDDLLVMREKEGQALGEELQSQLKLIEQRLAEIAPRTGQVVREYQERLTARVAELTEAARIRIDEESLAREVAIFAERSDIAEEMQRLTTHIAQFRKAMGSPEPAGRKLDFIAQEMLREANTIASKSNDAQIASAVVDIKTAIDRIKEQVQNAE